MMTTGQKLTFFRKKKNLTQEQLAEMLNVTRQSVSRWEMEEYSPHIREEITQLYPMIQQEFSGNKEIYLAIFKIQIKKVEDGINLLDFDPVIYSGHYHSVGQHLGKIGDFLPTLS